MTDSPTAPTLTSLARGGGCGCKLDPGVLDEILARTPLAGGFPDLIVDAAGRDDAAVYRLGPDQAIVATTDFFAPVVDDPDAFGRIAATNALSDVYAMGGKPIFCLALLGVPVGEVPAETIRAILEGGRAVAEAAGAPIAGGHSIDAAEPFYGLVALGLVHPDRILANAGARPGDALILGKPLGIGVFSAALKRGLLSDDDYARMIASTTLMNTPGADLAELDGVHAATDVTGFGLLGHLSEVCQASGVRAVVERAAVPVFDGARRLAGEGVRTGASGRNWTAVSPLVETPSDWNDLDRDLLCDPQTSGGLLVSCAPEAVDAVLEVFARHGHESAAVVGKIAQGAPTIAVT
ncbi:selenide, water dikinase SelD [Marinicauda salina]|uniref:Selenide, water dikinase n=1 Tax=Marinicauda salina TaxID=2135793 RepID=A0A2U2BT36_9PROT|nr:selenide, water dikinase SelD [Marinicauda salina]PWE17182.1 selenide, water dikinase SelD [Marinicauda salina]